MLTDETRTPQDPGMSWSGRTKCPPNDDECILTMVSRILRVFCDSHNTNSTLVLVRGVQWAGPSWVG